MCIRDRSSASSGRGSARTRASARAARPTFRRSPSRIDSGWEATLDCVTSRRRSGSGPCLRSSYPDCGSLGAVDRPKLSWFVFAIASIVLVLDAAGGPGWGWTSANAVIAARMDHLATAPLYDLLAGVAILVPAGEPGFRLG